MNNQKNRRLNRKTIKRKTIKCKTIKRKTIKRKQNKKIAYKQKKMYGGKFNKEQEIILKQLLEKFDYSDEELESVMEKLNSISQIYSRPYSFYVLIRKVNNSNSKIEFDEWLEKECCSDKYKGATDDEDDDYDEDDDN
jgi:hypothetical protein